GSSMPSCGGGVPGPMTGVAPIGSGEVAGDIVFRSVTVAASHRMGSETPSDPRRDSLHAACAVILSRRDSCLRFASPNACWASGLSVIPEYSPAAKSADPWRTIGMPGCQLTPKEYPLRKSELSNLSSEAHSSEERR